MQAIASGNWSDICTCRRNIVSMNIVLVEVLLVKTKRPSSDHLRDACRLVMNTIELNLVIYSLLLPGTIYFLAYLHLCN